MKYVGGKEKVAYQLYSTIVEDAPKFTELYEPFCGGLNVTKCFVQKGYSVYASDFNSALINLYRAILDGWIPPYKVTWDAFAACTRSLDTDPMKAFVNLACTFNGRWYGRYQHNCGQEVLRVRATLLALKVWMKKDNPILHDQHYLHFFDKIPEGSVVYLDPPYEGVYNAYCCDFDHPQFYNAVTGLLDKGCHVYLSEYKARRGKVLWEQEVNFKWHAWDQTRTERLYKL